MSYFQAPPPSADSTFWRPHAPEPGGPWRPGYRAAIVCRRGHVVESDVVVVPAEDQGFCPDCGARLLTRCQACRRRVRGSHFQRGVFDPEPYSPPLFCDVCGEPHPWADRTARIHQLENILDEEGVDEATRLMVSSDLARLRREDELTEHQQAEIWKRVKTRAPALFVGVGLRILDSVLTDYMKAHLGLP